MRFHRYLENVLGTKAGISILRALVRHKGKVFTVRGLARDAGVSGVEASRTVGQFERYGIVSVQPVGRAYQVTLNDSSYILNSVIRPVLESESRTVGKMISALARHMKTPGIISAAVFGSVARGEEVEDSDIDLLVISDHYDRAVEAVADASEEISSTFHGRLSPLIFDRKKFRAKKNDALVRSIISSYILVAGKEIEKIR
ncbi:MAG TPA: nucleotidyltransferase domain-containing protein [Candidatus Nitrosotalea sp.]|nr:nucleotidyltransferase domain-containing protein [Candidatus Nitrosotalea sp.]